MLIRSPIVSVLGHVDHGKTTILDAIRGSTVAEKEAGKITQMIGASYIPVDYIKKLSNVLLKKSKTELKIPGILLIDTPGHEAFTTLRDRGGSIADIVILVIDITQGIQPQTVESINILKHYKTPFIVAANKVDLVPGWVKNKTYSFLESFSKQPDYVKQKIDDYLYKIVGDLSIYGFESERFDRIDDFTKSVAIIPVSGKTKEGIAEILMLVSGLSQKFLGKRLVMDASSPAKGSVLEVKEVKNMGTVIDVIIYDGVLKKGDKIAYFEEDGIHKTTVRALLEPSFKRGEKYKYLDKVVAASGIRIFAPNLEGTIPGSPIKVFKSDADLSDITNQYTSLLKHQNETGVVICADSLGSAEAIQSLLNKHEIPIKYIHIGKVRKEDVLNSQVVAKTDKYHGVVLAFNTIIPTNVSELVSSSGSKIIYSDVIYDMVDKYEEWVKELKESEKSILSKNQTYPAEFRVMKGFIFRVSKPAVFGVKILSGTLKAGTRIMKSDGMIIGTLKSIQKNNKQVHQAEVGDEVAISIDSAVYKKDFDEDEILYTYLTKNEIMIWISNKEYLSETEIDALNKIRKIVIKSIF